MGHPRLAFVGGTRVWWLAIDDEVSYAHSTDAVIAWVQAGIDNPSTVNEHKNALAEENERGCTQNQQGESIQIED